MNLGQLLALFIGRACLSAIFILSGVRKILSWHGSLDFAHSTLAKWQVSLLDMPLPRSILDMMVAYLPLLLGLALFLELSGGLLILIGIKPRLGGALLLLFLIPTTALFHPFWLFTGDQQSFEMVMFMKNIAITGGLLCLLAIPSRRPYAPPHGK